MTWTRDPPNAGMTPKRLFRHSGRFLVSVAVSTLLAAKFLSFYRNDDTTNHRTLVVLVRTNQSRQRTSSVVDICQANFFDVWRPGSVSTDILRSPSRVATRKSFCACAEEIRFRGVGNARRYGLRGCEGGRTAGQRCLTVRIQTTHVG